MATESFDPRYRGLDARDDAGVLAALLSAQGDALASVGAVAPSLAAAARAVAARLGRGNGRLVYAGAGTSARLGVQDGVELVPTFGWPRERLGFLVAGGMAALTIAVEGAEDDEAAGARDARTLDLGPADVTVALSASGRTPYTLAACRAARAAGALTIGLANNPGAPLLAAAEHGILLDSGPEPIAGSTRMGAGTAQKVALNLLSTLAMMRLGRVYDGLMVDMMATNAKLEERARRMVAAIAGVDEAAAAAALAAAGGHVKTAALVAHGLPTDAARLLLDDHDGDLRAALARLPRRER